MRKKKKNLYSQELRKLFNEIEGTLIIKGAENWARFLKAYGFTLDELCSQYKIGGVSILFAKNPVLIRDVVSLDREQID